MELFQRIHVNDYFDRIFVINLRQNVQKLDITTHMLSRHGIVWERFEAVNGFEHEQIRAWEEYASNGLSHPFEQILQRKLIESPGAWGTLLTYKHLIEKARKEGLERILVLEDDIMIHRGFFTHFAKVVEELPSDWKLIYLGCRPDDWDSVKPFSEHLYYPSTILPDGYLPTTQGAFAHALHASTFDLALQHIETMEWPFDSGSLKEINRQFPKQTFVVQPHLFIPDISISSIREPGDNEVWTQVARAKQDHYEPRQLEVAPKTRDNKGSATLKVVAFLVVRYEGKCIERCLQYIYAQGIETCLIYQGCNNHPLEIPQHLIDQGVFRIEQIFGSDTEELENLILHKRKLAADIQADWFIHLDMDEIPEAPRPYISLLEGIQDADHQGYNTINFDEFIFVPADEKVSFEGKNYFQEMLHYYFIEPENRSLPRAWKKTTYPIDIRRNEGNSAIFPAQKVFPTPFRLRHYILNLQQGIEENGRLAIPQEAFALDQPHIPYQYRLKKLRNFHDWKWNKSEPWKRHTFFKRPERHDWPTEPLPTTDRRSRKYVRSVH